MNQFKVRDILKSLIAKGRKKNTLEILSQISIINKELKNDVTLLSQRFKLNENNNKKGVVSSSDYKSENNRIAESLLIVIDQISDHIEFENSMTFQDELLILNYSNDSNMILKELESRLEYIVKDFFKLGEQFRNRTPEYGWANELFFDRIQNIKKKWTEKRFKVSIVALIKSGKSTLLNALIGDEYLPSASEPETMQHIVIRHNPKFISGQLYFNLDSIELKGPKQIREKLRALNAQNRNNKKFISNQEMILEVNIDAFNNKKIEGYGFDILDTPGVNESDNAFLQTEIEKIVKQSDVIIYLLDYTKLNTKGEEEIFNKLKIWKEEIFTHASINRLFFIVNKIDQSEQRHSKRKGLTRSNIKEYVRKLIEKATEIQISNDDIILVSAERALLTKLMAKGKISSEQREDYLDFTFGEYYKNRAHEDDIRESIPEQMNKYGLRELESKVLETVYKLRSEIFYTSLIDDLNKNTRQVINNLEVGSAALKKNLKEIELFKNKLLKVENEIKSLSSQVDNYRDSVDRIIEHNFSNFKKELKKVTIDSFLKVTNKDYGSNFINLFASGLRRIKGAKIVSKEEEIVKKELDTIHKTVMRSIENKFDLTWEIIKRELYNEFIKASKKLEESAKPLIWKIEEVISENLEVEIKPTEIELERPSFNEFYQKTSLKIHDIVDEKKSISGKMKHLIFDMMNDIFKTHHKTDNRFIVSSRKYRNHINDIVEPLIDEKTKKEVKFLMNEKYVETIDKIRKSLLGYSHQYMAIIENDIKSRKEGTENTESRFENMKIDLENISSFNENFNRVVKIYKLLNIS